MDDDRERDFRNLFEALVAAKEAKPGAAKYALDKFLDLYPRFRPSVASARYVLQRRAPDYFVHG